MLDIVQIPVLRDNYLYLIHDNESGETAVVDPATHREVEAALEARGWRLTHILNTHHHWDHTGANLTLKEAHGLTIIGPRAEAERIPGLDIAVGEGEQITLGAATASVFDLPGHTAGHIAYHFADDAALFSGDVMFAMGCGRLFEGTAAQMLGSLSKLAALPRETRVYCAHEYTAANGAFALAVDANNTALQNRMEEVARLRAAGKPTIPTTIALELATNPFLRCAEPGLQKGVGLPGAPPLDVFAKARQMKDSF